MPETLTVTLIASIPIEPGLPDRDDSARPATVSITQFGPGGRPLVGLFAPSDTSGCQDLSVLTASEYRRLAAAPIEAAELIEAGAPADCPAPAWTDAELAAARGLACQ